MPYGIYKHKRKPLIERFWAKIQKTENCWLWTASCNQDGYGHLWIGENNGKLIGAHRLSWTIHFGEIPKGMLVLHKCDNPPCVNPSHLWIGTDKDNSVDMTLKNRAHHPGRKGADNSQAKLTTEDVIRIRNLYPQKSGQELADQYGLTRGHIYSIIHKRRWKWL